jgi:hypothetical protein
MHRGPPLGSAPLTRCVRGRQPATLTSKRALAQTWNIRRPRPRRRPAETAVGLGNRDVVDAGLAAAHQAGLVELPLLVAVGTMPLAGIVMPLVLKPHRDAVAVERPEILDQAIFMLLRPFAGQECDDRRPALKKFRAVAPAAVLGISQTSRLVGFQHKINDLPSFVKTLVGVLKS